MNCLPCSRIDNLIFRRGRKKQENQRPSDTSDSNSKLTVDVRKKNLQQQLGSEPSSDLDTSSFHSERIFPDDQQPLSQSVKAPEEDNQSAINNGSVHGVKIAAQDTKAQSIIKNVPKKRKILEHVTVTNEEFVLDSEKSCDKSSPASTCGNVDRGTFKRKSVWDRLGDGKGLFKRNQDENLKTSKESTASSSSSKTVALKIKTSDQYSDQAKNEARSNKSSSANDSSSKAVTDKKPSSQPTHQPKQEAKSSKLGAVKIGSGDAPTDKKPKYQSEDEPSEHSKGTELRSKNSSGKAPTDKKPKYLSKDEACEQPKSTEPTSNNVSGKSLVEKTSKCMPKVEIREQLNATESSGNSSSGKSVTENKTKCQLPDRTIGTCGKSVCHKPQDTSESNFNLNVQELNLNFEQQLVNGTQTAPINLSPVSGSWSGVDSKHSENRHVLSHQASSIPVDVEMEPEISAVKTAFVDLHTCVNDSKVSSEACVQENNISETSEIREDSVIIGATSHGISEDKTLANNAGCKAVSSEPQSKHPVCIAVPKQSQQFQPPLPKGDPAPLPPLPLTSPPPTPIKIPVNEHPTCELQKTSVNASQEQKDKLKMILFNVSHGTSQMTSGTPSPSTTDNVQVPKNVPASPWSDENLLMQCPFKPRRRAKTVMVLEDVIDESNQIIADSTSTSKPHSNLKVTSTSSISKSPDKRYKKSPMKKGDEYRASCDFRSQRPMYSSRHLSSVKSFAHMPERRSPSELLNGRSGRVERIPYEDKVRVRLRDRRSRSRSPLGKRVRRDESRTRFGRYEAPTRELNHRGVQSFQGKSDARQALNRKKSLSLKKNLQPLNDKEQIAKSKSKSRLIEELFGESSPQSKIKIASKHPEPSTNSSVIKHPPDPIEKKNDKSLPVATSLSQKTSIHAEKNSSSNRQIDTDVNKKVCEENIICIRRRPRSGIHLEDSESSINTVVKKLVNTSSPLLKGENNEVNSNSVSPTTMKPKGTSTPLEGRDDISFALSQDLKLTGDQNQEHRNSAKRQIEKTPLYFKEKNSVSNVSDQNFQNTDPFCESDNTTSSADSDVTYDPKRSNECTKQVKRSVRPRK